MRTTWLYLALTAALCAAPVSADVWDVAGDSDDNSGTDNELTHGTNQVHDLGVRPGPTADQDWYRIGQKAFSSYEVLVDSTTGDIGFNNNLLQRVDASGTTVIQNGVSVTPGLDYSRSLRWANVTSTDVNGEFIRVGPGSCGVACDGNDVYHIRSRETTISVARFNASGTQATVLLTQNLSTVPVSASFFYWSSTGTLLQTGTLTNHPPKALNVFSVGTFPALAGQSGHITVAHDGPHGSLSIKTVALEPSTGFSFDTPGVYKPY
jgi:hypothetical protein